MDDATRRVMRECTEGSDAGTITFPEVVRRLGGVGVERYYADLVRSEKIYYMPDGESELLKAHAVSRPIAQKFVAADVDAAVRAVQARKVNYAQFCEAIADA